MPITNDDIDSAIARLRLRIGMFAGGDRDASPPLDFDSEGGRVRLGDPVPHLPRHACDRPIGSRMTKKELVEHIDFCTDVFDWLLDKDKDNREQAQKIADILQASFLCPPKMRLAVIESLLGPDVLTTPKP